MFEQVEVMFPNCVTEAVSRLMACSSVLNGLVLLICPVTSLRKISKGMLLLDLSLPADNEVNFSPRKLSRVA
jgi:hypothetical protein